MEHFVEIFSGVAKIVVTVVGSAIASTQIPRPRETLKDFGFLITNVLLPCLFLSQMVEAVSLEMLLDSYVLFLVAACAIVIGYIASVFLTRFLFPETIRFSTTEDVSMKLVVDKIALKKMMRQRAMAANGAVPSAPSHAEVPKRLIIRIPTTTSADAVMQTLVIPSKEELSNVGYRTCITIATMLQNTFVLPMSLLQSLATKKKGELTSAFDWIDLNEVTAYIFFFNIVITIAFWTVGPLIIRAGARLTADRMKICDIIARHNAQLTKISQATQTCGVWVADKNLEETFPAEPYSWRSGETGDSITVVKHGDRSVDEDADALPPSGHSLDWSKVKANIAPLINAPLLSTFLGIFLGLVPLTKEFLIHGYGRIIFDVCRIVGDGTMPASLFLLGCNLSTDFSVVAAKAKTFKHFSQGMLMPNARNDTDSDDSYYTDEDADYDYEEEEMKDSPQTATAGGATDANQQKPVSAGDGKALPPKTNESFTQADADISSTYFGQSFVKGQDPVLLALADKLAKENAAANSTATNEVAPAPSTEADGKSGAKKKAHKNKLGIRMKKIVLIPAARSLPSIQKLYSLEDINRKFIAVLMVTRLLVLPAILFALTYLLVKSGLVSSIADPCNNLLLLTMLVELFAPSAINTALLFNLEQFMVREYSKALLYQYSFAVLTLMGWLMLTIQFVRGDSCRA